MRHLFILLLLLTLVTLNSLAASPFGKNEVHVGKLQNKMIRVSISEEMEKPLAVYLYDKKTGEQLKYKYWKPGRVRELRYDVANYRTKSYLIEVKLDGVIIYKKTIN